MRYLFAFPVLGTPVAALTPAITGFRRLDGTAPTPSAPTVYELNAGAAPGWYYFDFISNEHVVVTVDGGASLSSTYRYQHIEAKPVVLADEVVEYTAWDARGNPTAGVVYGYQNGDDGPDFAYEGAIGATYDATGRLTSFTRRR